MSEQNELFFSYLDTVDSRWQSYVKELNDLLIESGYDCDIKKAAKGYAVAYAMKKPKHTVINFVTRKNDMKVRIYADHISQFSDLLNRLPEELKQQIKDTSACKRLLDPNDCNPRCKMGYTFIIDGEEQKKCRYSAFMFSMNEEIYPYIKEMVEREITA